MDEISPRQLLEIAIAKLLIDFEKASGKSVMSVDIKNARVGPLASQQQTRQWRSRVYVQTIPGDEDFIQRREWPQALVDPDSPQ